MKRLRRRSIAAVSLAMTIAGPAGTARSYASQGGEDDDTRTATPIKHVIVFIGENHTFDNIFATYVPKEGQHVSNLLSKGIIDASGLPGSNHALAEQFKISTINPVSYFIDTDTLTNPNKTAYAPFLPTPEVGFAPPQLVTLAQFLEDPADTVARFDARTFSRTELHTISPVIERGLTRITRSPTIPVRFSLSRFVWTATNGMRDFGSLSPDCCRSEG